MPVDRLSRAGFRELRLLRAGFSLSAVERATNTVIHACGATERGINTAIHEKIEVLYEGSAAERATNTAAALHDTSTVLCAGSATERTTTAAASALE